MKTTREIILEQQAINREIAAKENDKMKQQIIYIHETTTLYSENGEVHIETCNGALFNDLPALATFCLKEIESNKKNILKELKELK